MWDRWVIIALAAAVAIRAGYRGWQFGKGGDWLAGAGGFVLALIAIGVPLILAVLGPSTGR
ncbi:MAG TPA: hypothetical protein VD969_07045 [Symbiobacteriaceae bacterium]|nr:hypothetical protein [Symbiobacteriaceae bacterium]